MGKGLSSLTFILFFSWCSANAQSTTEWIDYEQSYIKLKIAENGWYQVTGSELQAAGFPVATTPASQIQLFRKGEEVAIKTVISAGAATLDYFEFWGEKNDGRGDADLYRADTQPHNYYSIFSDTATYFLTWSANTTAKRISTNTQNSNTGLAATTFHTPEVLIIQSSRYATGRRLGQSGDFQLSSYDVGEGWTGARVGKNAFEDFTVQLGQADLSAGDPIIEVIAIAENSLEHVVSVQAGPDIGQLTEVGKINFDGYGSFLFQQTLNWSQVSGDGSMAIRLLVEGVPGAADFVSFAAIRVRFPQALTFNVGDNRLLRIEPSATDRTYLQIASPDPASFSYYDITDPSNVIFLPQNIIGTRADLIVPNTLVPREIAVVSSFKTVPSLELYQFNAIDINSSNYLIITHPLLRAGDQDSDPIAAYEAYRSSVQGGSHDVVVAHIQDIYDQYNYGDPSVLAIRRLIEQGYSQRLQNVLIIAKGRTVNQNLYRQTYSEVDDLSTSPIFIPTYGIPGGDFMYSIGLDNSRPLVPAIPIGRLNMWQPEQVRAYLNKLIEMEQLPNEALWRKDLIHLSGGRTAQELSSFSNHIEDFSAAAEGRYLGGSALNQSKQTSAVVEQFDLSTEINKGIGYVTLFGHSSNTVTDIEIGRPSNTAFNYQNAGKYPFIIVNGCKAGEIFGNTVSFGEDWISFPDKGAIGFVAHADQASSTNLKRFTDRLYQVGFADTAYFESTVGEIITEASERFFLSGTSEIQQTQIQQTLYQGDPAYLFFGPDRPDFDISEFGIDARSLAGGQILAQQDSFSLAIPIANYGVTTDSMLTVSITRNFPDGSVLVSNHQVVAPYYADTAVIYLVNPADRLLEGVNDLTITLNPEQQIIEPNQMNNSATYSLFISSGNTLHLMPYDQATIGDEQANLIWQPSNPLESTRTYALEVDTTSSFSSAAKRSFSLTGQDVLQQLVPINLYGDSVTYFWRSRFADAMQNEDSIWTVSSLTYIQDGSGGWGQFSLEQFADSELAELSISSGALDFAITEVPVTINTMGTGQYSYEDLLVSVAGTNLLVTSNTIDPFCAANTFNAIVFDRNLGLLKNPIFVAADDVFNSLICGRLPQSIYNFTLNDLVIDRRLEELVNKMSNGDQVVFFSIDSVSYASFDAAMLLALEQVGVASSTLESLTNGQPLVIFGTKGAAPGTANVVSSDGSGLPAIQQSIRTDLTVTATAGVGEISTPLVGPATAWQDVTVDFIQEGSDQLEVFLIGQNRSGSEDQLLVFEGNETIDLTGVDAELYPYLQLRLAISDEVELTPPQFNHMSVTFQGAPEAILLADTKEPQNLQEGQTMSANFRLINVGNTGFTDSLEVSYELRNSESEQLTTFIEMIAPIASNDTTVLLFESSTVGQGGENALRLTAASQAVERLLINNQITIPQFATVEEETIDPLLDVTIDGRYILDGEIVSSRPMVQVKVTDENPFLLKTDTVGVEVFLRMPGETSDFQRISFGNADLNWSPSTVDTPFQIDYQPTLSTDGIYTLRVIAEDASGNEAGTEPYEIAFEIVNASSITHFYPYPNPFSTSCRFVFTVTGNVVPDQLMIQIMTVSGRVVKTIDESELGSITIGNNVSDYVWDGTDEYGDQLANGVYLYRVKAELNGQQLDHRSTAADRGFKRGIGKIYILR